MSVQDHRNAHRVALHPKTRQLVKRGGNRTQWVVVTVSRPPHPNEAGPDPGNRRLAGRPEQASREGGLAVYDHRRAGEIEEALPVTLNDSRH